MRVESGVTSAVTCSLGCIAEAHDEIGRCLRAECYFVFGQPTIHGSAPGASHAVGDIEREIRHAVDSLHQLEHREALDDDGLRRRQAALDDSVDLIVEIEDVISRGYEEQIG